MWFAAGRIETTRKEQQMGRKVIKRKTTTIEEVFDRDDEDLGDDGDLGDAEDEDDQDEADEEDEPRRKRKK
jgi:hypothetical protein